MEILDWSWSFEMISVGGFVRSHVWTYSHKMGEVKGKVREDWRSSGMSHSGLLSQQSSARWMLLHAQGELYKTWRRFALECWGMNWSILTWVLDYWSSWSGEIIELILKELEPRDKLLRLVHDARRKKNIVNTMYHNFSWHQVQIWLYNKCSRRFNLCSSWCLTHKDSYTRLKCDWQLQAEYSGQTWRMGG